MQISNPKEKTSNEISVQVGTTDLFFTPSKKKSSLRLSTNHKIEFKPDMGFPIHQQVKSQFLSSSKSHRKRHSALSYLPNVVNPEKDPSVDDLAKISIHVEVKKPRRCHSGGFLPEKQLDRMRVLKKSSDYGKDHLEVVHSQKRLEKNPSAYRIPNIYDPLSNFSTRHLPLKLSKCQPKSRVFKNYQACLAEAIDLSLKTGKRLKINKMKDCKRRYYFRHNAKPVGFELFN
jgi:hypothetical protein